MQFKKKMKIQKLLFVLISSAYWQNIFVFFKLKFTRESVRAATTAPASSATFTL